MNKWLTKKCTCLLLSILGQTVSADSFYFVMDKEYVKNMCILNNKFHDGQFQVSQEDVSLFIIHGPYRSLHTIYHV